MGIRPAYLEMHKTRRATTALTKEKRRWFLLIDGVLFCYKDNQVFIITTLFLTSIGPFSQTSVSLALL